MARNHRDVPAILQSLPSLADLKDKERPLRIMLAAMEYYGIDPSGDSEQVAGGLLYALLVDRFPAFRDLPEKRPGRPSEHEVTEMARLHERVTALFNAAGLDPSKKGSTKKLLAAHREALKSEFPGFAKQETVGAEYNYLRRCRQEHATYQHWRRWERKHMQSLIKQFSPTRNVTEKG